MQALLNFLVSGYALGLTCANSKEDDEEEEASSNSPKQVMHSTNTLEHVLILLKCMVNKHVFMNIISLGKNSTLTNSNIWQYGASFVNQYHMQ
jgi:hypothetical protein